MKRILTFILTFIVMILGALIVFSNPMDPTAIVVGMFLVSVAILNLAIQIYFPQSPEQTVELKVLDEPVEAPKENIKPIKRVEKVKKPVKSKKKR